MLNITIVDRLKIVPHRFDGFFFNQSFGVKVHKRKTLKIFLAF